MTVRRIAAAAAVLVLVAVALLAAAAIFSRPVEEGPLWGWLGDATGAGDLSFELATVDGEAITRGELYDCVLPPRAEGRLFVPLWPDISKLAAAELVRGLAIELRARKIGVSVTQGELAARYSRVLSRSLGRDVIFDTPAAAAALERLGLGEADFRRQIALMLATEKLMAADGVRPPDPFAEGAAGEVDRYLAGLVRKVKIEADARDLPPGLAMRVGGVPVTRERLARQILLRAPREKSAAALERLISKRIIESAFAARGWELSQADSDAHVEYLEGTFMVRPELREITFAEHLAATRTTMAKFTSTLGFRLNAMITRLARDRLEAGAVGKALAERPTRYGLGQRRVAHIHLPSVDPVTERKLTEKELDRLAARMKRIHGKLVAGDSVFEEVAANVNSDGAERRRGVIGWLARGDCSKELSDAAYSTGVGEFSAPFADGRGWHIVKPVAERRLPEKSARKLAECDLLVGLRGEVRRELSSAARVVRSKARY